MLEKYEALAAHFAERNAMAEEWDLPRQWIVCPTCSMQMWVLPPHGFDECPIVIEGMQQLGMKMDAERMAAIRTGIGIEEIARAASELAGGEE